MPPNYHGIALLLSLGALPLACVKDSGETDDGTTSNTATGADTTGTTGTTGTTADTMASDSTATTGTQPTGDITTTTTDGEDTGNTTPQPTTFLTTDTADNTDGDTFGETFGDTEDLPPPTDPVCLDYAAHLVECIPRYADSRVYFAQDCEYNKAYSLQADGQACLDARDAVYVCISKLDCADIVEQELTGCSTEIDAFFAACPSQTDGDTDTDADTDADTGNDPDDSTG